MSLLDESHRDAMADALALTEAVHNQDLEGGRAILDNCNARLTMAALANILAGVLEDWTDDPAGAFALLREHHAGGG